jgi:hypothetical protein
LKKSDFFEAFEAKAKEKRMTRRISMTKGMQVARQATADIDAWLRSLPQTLRIQNVEDNPAYQQIDVDLLWSTDKRCYQVEIKGDRWHQTCNFFFETHSNKEKGTPGCFLYTQADLLFYYFVVPRHLYILPMPATRDWFLANIQRFNERATTTPVGYDYYTTVGRLVPIAIVSEEVTGVIKQQL